MRCVICGKPGEHVEAAAWDGVELPSPGIACARECARMLFFRPEDKALELWLWRARRAESLGLVFNEPVPMTEADKRFEAMKLKFGWRAT